MIKDIEFPEVKNIVVAVVLKTDLPDVREWEVYVINQNDFAIDQVLVTSRGYGEIDGESKKTSTLRHYLERVEAHSYAIIEPIQEDVFVLNNEYWLSFYHNGKMFDKKFLFTAGALDSNFLSDVPLMEKSGIVHP
ncbi:hypothetical protein KFE98_07915 [bacterium SCSIO 12741]|nr:hypothetical protein KFE98_07915 [bacterium SCSIO 12741]